MYVNTLLRVRTLITISVHSVVTTNFVFSAEKRFLQCHYILLPDGRLAQWLLNIVENE